MMELTEEQIIEFNKKFVTLLAPLAGELAGKCGHCGGTNKVCEWAGGCVNPNPPDVCDTPHGDCIDCYADTSCPHCRTLRGIADEKWHEVHGDECSICGKIEFYEGVSGQHAWHKNSTFTIQSLIPIFKTVEIWESFIGYIESDYPHEVKGEMEYGTTQKEMVDILTIHDQFIKVAASYLEVLTSK